MKLKLPVVLFFIAGSMPTEEEYAEANELKAQVRFRNVSLIIESDCVEEFDDVAGLVPEAYELAKIAKEEAKAEAQAKAEAAEKLAEKLAKAAAKEAAKNGQAATGATGAAPTNSPAPVAAPGGGNGPPADWKPA